MLELQIVRADVQHVAAEAILVPVDGALCRLGGAAANRLRSLVPRAVRLRRY
ncbi:MAG TPA: hypothetical protein VFP84_16130 [Kofleriaceae bacterium]|nr:hypothetical protein [Kofleriaceae bacterium]